MPRSLSFFETVPVSRLPSLTARIGSTGRNCRVPAANSSRTWARRRGLSTQSVDFASWCPLPRAVNSYDARRQGVSLSDRQKTAMPSRSFRQFKIGPFPDFSPGWYVTCLPVLARATLRGRGARQYCVEYVGPIAGFRLSSTSLRPRSTLGSDPVGRHTLCASGSPLSGWNDNYK